MNIYNDLEYRQLINQVTDENIKTILQQPQYVYCGFDPTADSLHIGHLLPLCMLKRFLNDNHHAIALIGGATGLIGDPSFKKDERSLNSKAVVIDYANSIKKQINNIINDSRLIIVNNYDWVKEINMIDFLRDYGKYFSINYMINKDCVASRIEKGISFTEFSYMLLQAMDFLQLNQQYGCNIQIGGSDQWGNITTGLELIRKKGIQTPCYGLTIPLVTKADGTKFGKTEGGAIWLDPLKTSPYDFYQYFYNVEDQDVIKYLKYFTFLEPSVIDNLAQKVIDEPFKREAQKVLAAEVTTFVHGKAVLDEVLKITQCLFTGDIKSLTLEEIEKYFKNIKKYHTHTNKALIDVLIDVNLASSRRESREFITNNSIRINGDVINDIDYILTNDDLIANQYCMIKRGKKLIHFVSVNEE